MSSRFVFSIMTLLMTLISTSSAQAITLRGEIQPDRYTYYLTDQYAQKLWAMNRDRNRTIRFNLPPGELVAQTDVSFAYQHPAPTAITCISSIYYNQGARANWLKVACIDNNGLEYSTHQKWPDTSIAKRVCKVGEASCDAFLTMNSDNWSGPQ